MGEFSRQPLVLGLVFQVICIFCLHRALHSRMVLFLSSLGLFLSVCLFVFFYTGLSSAFDFSMRKYFFHKQRASIFIFEAQKMIAFSSDIMISDKLAHFN